MQHVLLSTAPCPASDPTLPSRACASCTVAVIRAQVPAANRALLAAEGVDWAALAAEVAALPQLELLPPSAAATCHGDIHEANLMWRAAAVRYAAHPPPSTA
eukprot:SAG11_NODE_2519_length_3263_cov_5.689001_2_plen_102_part_00